MTALFLAACGSAAQRTTSATTPFGVGTPDQQAEALLARLELPPGVHRTASLASPQLQSPATSTECHPLIDHTRRWLVSGDPAAVNTYFLDHVPAGMTRSTTGQQEDAGRLVSWDISYSPIGTLSQADTLEVALAASNGAVGIRADGQVIPPGAGCASAGGTKSG